LLYRCRLTSASSEPSMLHVGGDPRPGAIGWFPGRPEQIYPGHEVYLRFSNRSRNQAQSNLTLHPGIKGQSRFQLQLKSRVIAI
jgi:hypothetical protein